MIFHESIKLYLVYTPIINKKRFNYRNIYKEECMVNREKFGYYYMQKGIVRT